MAITQYPDSLHKIAAAAQLKNKKGDPFQDHLSFFNT